MANLSSQMVSLGGRRLDSVANFFLTDNDSGQIPTPRPGPSADTLPGTELIPVTDAQSPMHAIVCSDGIVPHGALLGCLLAKAMSAANITVGLVETTARLPHTFFLFGGHHNLDAVFWEDDPQLPEFLNIVARLRKTSDLLLLSMTSSNFFKCTELMALTGRCLVPTTVHTEELLKVYGLVKKIANDWKGADIELVVFGDQQPEKIAGAAAVLEKMARQFLPCAVRFIGGIPVAMDATAFEGCVSGSLLRGLPEKVTTAAGEIAGNLMKSAGF